MTLFLNTLYDPANAPADSVSGSSLTGSDRWQPYDPAEQEVGDESDGSYDWGWVGRQESVS